MSDYVVVSKNEKRNLQMVIGSDGKTRHIPIDPSRPVLAKRTAEIKPREKIHKRNEKIN